MPEPDPCDARLAELRQRLEPLHPLLALASSGQACIRAAVRPDPEWLQQMNFRDTLDSYGYVDNNHLDLGSQHGQPKNLQIHP
jgi:hypothetical protein